MKAFCFGFSDPYLRWGFMVREAAGQEDSIPLPKARLKSRAPTFRIIVSSHSWTKYSPSAFLSDKSHFRWMKDKTKHKVDPLHSIRALQCLTNIYGGLRLYLIYYVIGR